MNTFFILQKSHAKTVSTFLILIAALAVTLMAPTAHADTALAQLSIASNGQVIVKNAVVTSISGTVITAKSAWGTFSMTWTIETSGSTHFMPDAKSTKALASIKVGDGLAFTGDIDTHASSPTVTASMVKDTAIERDAVTEDGSVLSVDPDAGTFVISTDTGTTTVQTGNGAILTRDGNYATLADLQIGTDVEVMGSLNTETEIMIAQRASWKTPPESESMTSSRQGMISGFFSWLLDSRGALSFL